MFSNRAQKAAVAFGTGYVGYRIADSQFQISADVALARKTLPMLAKTRGLIQNHKSHTVVDTWYETCNAGPKEICMINADTGEELTFEQVDRASNRIAQWAVSRGLQEGDVVGILMENCPEYVITWLGLAKAGIVTAWINSNNKQRPLLHSIDIVSCKMLLFDEHVMENVEGVANDLQERGIAAVSVSEDCCPGFATNLPSEAKALSDSPVPASRRGKSGIETVFAYIYTSGTTGLPKACVIKHFKFISVGLGFFNTSSAKRSERVYTCLPLYHSAGGVLGAGCMVTSGCCMIVCRKFSASRFFEHCTKYDADIVQYIGELCRYLLNGKPSPWDRKHHVRMAYGNGLRREIWCEFCDRFGINEIGEFYGSTEGNVSFFNHYYHDKGEGVGAMGRVGSILKAVLGFEIVQHDIANEVPVRDPKTGFCIPVPPGQAGELLGRIDERLALSKFEGYSNPEDTAKKVVQDVFVKGDRFFRTGDLVRRDPDGYVYFVDRIGDTFRWKGENVSTGEVSEVISVIDGVLEANVYGVQIPGHEDGRACMTAIVTRDGQPPDMDAFAKTMFTNLAPYAVPLFVRILPQMDITGTFKHRKVDFVKEGFDINNLTDKIFFLDMANKKYIPLTPEVLSDIMSPQSKL